MADANAKWTGGRIALLTAGRDKPYAYGMAAALIAKGLSLDIIGGDDLESSDWGSNESIRFFNLRGDMRSNANLSHKVLRVLSYYLRLIRYAASAKPKVFHILWNNKLEVLDRTVLMLYYKILGKRIVLTVHNVNARRRDGSDNWLNRNTLMIQYRLADHLFVHTDKMKQELGEEFGIPELSITTIPFGVNNDVPRTDLTNREARQRLGISTDDRTILFFGHIAPYKGLEYLVEAFQQLVTKFGNYRLIIAGNPKNCNEYWDAIQKAINNHSYGNRVLQKIEHIPDGDTEVYFKAADVLALPYRHVYQSGVLSLGYSFGLPVIATDVGSLREDIIEGKTGFVCRPEDPTALARAIERYFETDLYSRLSTYRKEIREYACRRYSWDVVSELTKNVYEDLLGKHWAGKNCQLVPP